MCAVAEGFSGIRFFMLGLNKLENKNLAYHPIEAHYEPGLACKLVHKVY